MARGRRAPRIIVDYAQCIRVPDEDRRVASESHGYKCEWCEREGSYNGVLVFKGESVPVCREYHELLFSAEAPRMVPV